MHLSEAFDKSMKLFTTTFEVNENKKVMIRKATPIDFEFAKALEGTLSEWSSKNDEEAYRDL